MTSTHFGVGDPRAHIDQAADGHDPTVGLGARGKAVSPLAIELREAVANQDLSERRFQALFDRAPDAIIVADADGRCIDANPAASALLGSPRDELLGRRFFTDLIGIEDGAALDGAWQGFLRTGSASGAVRLRRPDGTLRFAEYIVTAEVIPGHHLGILRDVTERRWTQQLATQRARIIEAFHRMRPGATPELTAVALCAEVTRHSEVPNAAIFAFDENGTLTTLASSFEADRSVRLPRHITEIRAARLRERAAHGAWVETFDELPDNDLRTQLAALGMTAVAFAPIEVGGQVLGLLAAGDGMALVEGPVLLATVEDFAALAASLLGGPLHDRRRIEADWARIERTIANGAFHPVFQPIVDLGTGAIVGHEALTRFDDGLAPEHVFAMAARCDHGIALEVATIKAALEAATRLPTGSSIHINVSPGLILANEILGRLLARPGLEVVLEVTEHERVADYSKLRAAVRGLGTEARIAVDDAGSGFASLRHILELRPEVVKLDRALVAGIDDDPARQALVAGMVHFADGIGALLIAEGIETEGELETLKRLGTRAGQGDLLGRPLPAPDDPTIGLEASA
jgi:PAS domain S-box-containing protein